MPIVLNGSTNVISGVAVGGLPDGIVDTDMLAANAVATAKIADDAITDAKQNLSGTAKAWVNFSLAGSIRDDFNIDALTDNGTGLFTVSFTNAMANANYCCVSTGAGAVNTTLSGSNYNRVCESTPNSTANFSVACYAPNNGTLVDVVYAGVAVFGD